MTALFLSPHHDDETLFAAYTLLREKPWVLVLFEPVKQEAVPAGWREAEFERAMEKLGLVHHHTRKGWPDTGVPTPDQIEGAGEQIRGVTDWSHVYAPAKHEAGHEQHNVVADLAMTAFRDVPITWYETYRRGEGRTRGSTEVVPEPWMVAQKLAAMACYRSQLMVENTRPWFDDWMREWYA